MNAAQRVSLWEGGAMNRMSNCAANTQKIHIIGWEGHIMYLLIDFSSVETCTLLAKSVMSIAITRRLRS